MRRTCTLTHLDVDGDGCAKDLRELRLGAVTDRFDALALPSDEDAPQAGRLGPTTRTPCVGDGDVEGQALPSEPFPHPRLPASKVCV